MAISARPLRLSRDLRNVPLHKYRLPTDGKKWKPIARQRMALAEWLATHGDPDGSRIYPGEPSMTRHFGWSRRTTFNRLKDLKTLGLLSSEGLTSEHGTRKRRMDLTAFLGPGVQDSQGAGVQDSRAGVQSNVAHDRHLTDQIQIMGREQSSVSSPSPKTHKPTIALSLRTIEDMSRSAKIVLVSRGYDADLVDVALLVVGIHRSLLSKQSPRTPAYFVKCAEECFADEQDLALCRSIIAKRKQEGISLDEPLSLEEWDNTSKAALVRWSVEEASRRGISAAQVQAEYFDKRVRKAVGG